MPLISASSATRVALLIAAYAVTSLLAVTMVPAHGPSLFEARWPVVLLGPFGFLLDEHYWSAFLQSSLIVIALAAPALVVRSRYSRAMLVGALALWLITGLAVLAIPY